MNGLMTYDNHKDGNIFGLYSYSVNNPSERKLLTLMPFVAPNGGAVYRNGKFYMFTPIRDKQFFFFLKKVSIEA